jgi:hypothetical protein
MAYGSSDHARQTDKLRTDVDGLSVRWAIIQDQRASGVSAGSSRSTLTADNTYITADSTEYTADMTLANWLNRELNTIVSDDAGIIERLDGNTFLLAPGRYMIRARATFHFTHGTRVQIWDATNEESVGESCNLYIENTVDTCAEAVAIVEPNKPTTYRIKRRCGRSTSGGLGRAVSFGTPEIYCTVEVAQIASLKP